MKFARPFSEFVHRWHQAISDFSRGQNPWPRFMYQAKNVADEVPRLQTLFAMEREGKLGKVHKQCSHSEAVPCEDNHLTCCLGHRTSTCKYLQALNSLPVEEQDVAKSWTCAAHILMEGGDVAGEGFMLTSSDRMFWDNVYNSLAQGDSE